MRYGIYVTILIAFAGCGSRDERPVDTPDGDADGDIDCDGGPAVELDCPSLLELGCIPSEGVPLEADVTALACSGDPEIVCVPAVGNIIHAGETAVRCTASAVDGDEATCEFDVYAITEGAFALLCPETTEAECMGALTEVDVPLPEVDEQCGSMVGAFISDEPAEGFGSGLSTVQYSASGENGTSASCEMTVSVTDSLPPALECPDGLVVARESFDHVATPPELVVTDLCDGELTALPSPGTLLGPTTTVTYTAIDASGNSASCETEVTLLEAHAVTGLRLASATLGGDGSTSISLAWNPADGVDATGYRVERSASETGPWTELDALELDELTFTDEALPGEVMYYRIVTVVGALDGGVAGPLRALAVADEGYDLRGQSVSTVPFSTTLYGVVRYPVALDEGPFPLVLFLHGNHGNCRPSPFTRDDECAHTENHECPWGGYTTTPNAEGLAYLGETLAAQGYITASLSGNALNCRDDYIIERSELIIEHLRRWETWSSTGGSPFGEIFVGVVDMENVGLVGHSRGGEAVAHVPTRLASSPITGVELASIFSIAPTDYHEPHPEGVPYAVLLPGCDGDVFTLAGMHIYDRSLTPAEPVVREQVFFPGANHNFFSTEWRYDDNGWGVVCPVSAEVGDTVQQRMLETTLSAWFNGTIIDPVLEDFLEADGPVPAGIDAWTGIDLDLRMSYAAASRELVDDFSGSGAPNTNELGESNAFVDFDPARACNESGCDASFQHRLDALFISWDGGGPVATYGLGGLDASEAEAISFRVTSRWSRLNNSLVEQDFLIRVRDTSGVEVELPLSSIQPVLHLYRTNLIREVLQTVRVPIDHLVMLAPDLDVASLEALEFEMTLAGHSRGSVIVTNIELAHNGS